MVPLTASGPRTDRPIEPAARLAGELRLPGDKSISHRALMLGLLGAGESRITGASDGADVRSTAAILKALGARVERAPGEAGNVDYVVTSTGGTGLRRPSGVIDCGNSGTSMRLFAGIVAGHPIEAVLDGDASLRRPPDGPGHRATAAMGARVEGRATAGRQYVVGGPPHCAPSTGGRRCRRPR